MFYSLLYTIAFCVAVPFLLLSPKSRGKYLATFRKRFGRLPQLPADDARPAIWVHAVSVGEALAARSLVSELRTAYPDHRIIVSTTTGTGQEIARRELNADAVFYFPFDWKFTYRRIVRALRVTLCLVMETELWPNFTKVLRQKRIPLVLVNGRISDRSFAGYRRHRWFFAPVLRRFHSLCAQSDLDARRLIEIGARDCDVIVTGNLKYGRGQFAVAPEKIAEVRRRFAIGSEDVLFVAGSTHEGEEEAALDAFIAARQSRPELRLALVPRKPERFDEVDALIRCRGFIPRRWSAGVDSAASPVLLLDTVGKLTALYHLARVAFVGGSLIPRGGHNLLEACAASVPVLFGPHMHNFRTVKDDVLAAGAGMEVAHPQALALALDQLLADPVLWERTSHAAADVTAKHQSALPKTLEVVAEALPWSGVRSHPSVWARAFAALHAAASSVLRGDPRRELERAKRLDRPVISVGGLGFGGAGKTPLVSLLAETLIAHGKHVAVLTRGYGGSGAQPMLAGDGAGNIASAEEAGDEAVMLASQHPQLIVIRDADRYRGGRMALQKFEPDLFLLDDGFQHRALARDLNLLTLDADSVVGARYPGHLLREPMRFAAAADAIIVRGESPWRLDAALALLAERFPGMPLFRATWILDGCRELSGQAFSPEKLAGLRCGAVCGIAAPSRFLTSAAALGIRPVFSRCFPDHHRYTAADLAELSALLPRTGADAMITTEKDEQRLAAALRESPNPLRILVLTGSLRIERYSELTDLVMAPLTR